MSSKPTYGKTYRTRVCFDDGFVFAGHDTEVKTERFLNMVTYHMKITEDMKVDVVLRAIAAHEKAVAKRDERLYLDTLSFKDAFLYRRKAFFKKVSANFSANRVTYIALAVTVAVLAIIIAVAIATA